MLGRDHLSCMSPIDQLHARHDKASISLPTNWTSTLLYYNFVVFCLLYAVVHATVDAVVAFSTAELGSNVGSIGGFSLYTAYTCSALLFAKPILRRIGPKNAMQFGLTCLLMYVGSFLVSVLRKKHSSILFTVGSIVGGIGAGILWSAQGSYFALNARYYALSGNTRGAHSLTTFASIFATSLLILEFVVKTGATAMYISSLQGSAGWPWREVVFSTYTAIALCAVVLFWVCVLPLPSISTAYASRATSGMSAVEMQARSTHGLMAVPTSDTPEEEDEDAQGPDPGQSGSESPADSSQAVTSAMHGEHMNEFPATDINGGPSMSSAVRMGHTGAIPDEEYAQDGQEEIISVSDIYSVTNLILTNRAMQLMLPYQLCFGFSAGLVNSYILGVVVKVHIQDGYVGLLSGITALTAGVLSMPFALLANRYARGRWAVMVFGALCFAFAGAVVLCLSDEVLSSWVWIVTFFVIHGAARGVWESTNKAVIALYFSEAETQQAAFSAVYFASGLSGALGFLLSGLASRESIAALNLVISMVALVCYHISS